MTADTLQHWSWLDELEEGIVLVEAGRVSYLNRAAAELLEVAPTQAMNQPIIAVFRDHRLERAYEMGEAVELETRGRRLLAKPVSGGMSLQDLSRLRQAQESARELLAVLSHELRTPATTVRATLEALRMELPAAEREHFLRQAEAEVERLIRLLEDLTVDVKPPNMRRILLTDVAERAQALLQDTLDSRGIDLVVSLPPLTVWADSDKLLQVLINLLENAAQHGPEHKTVWLSAQPDPEDASFIRVSVRDQGEP
ncbi:MAG TPA: histidine kinase dimerization/phospho-acceptor domain-containing protein, partial [Trueperaceae bacterium]